MAVYFQKLSSSRKYATSGEFSQIHVLRVSR